MVVSCWSVDRTRVVHVGVSNNYTSKPGLKGAGNSLHYIRISNGGKARREGLKEEACTLHGGWAARHTSCCLHVPGSTTVQEAP